MSLKYYLRVAVAFAVCLLVFAPWQLASQFPFQFQLQFIENLQQSPTDVSKVFLTSSHTYTHSHTHSYKAETLNNFDREKVFVYVYETVEPSSTLSQQAVKHLPTLRALRVVGQT